MARMFFVVKCWVAIAAAMTFLFGPMIWYTTNGLPMESWRFAVVMLWPFFVLLSVGMAVEYNP